METINPKSMFTKGQTAYSIALLSYKDDETEKIITHTISKVACSSYMTKRKPNTLLQQV